MTLSVVVVNYNVKYFLEQCLISIFKSMKGIDGEVFVVDNASADGSCQMVKQRFPNVILIENKDNFGFSYANNQAIRVAKGDFVLLLNPDTVVEEDTFSKCIEFMHQHPNAGSLSVKMIDGKGKFLPESKRAMPSPMVSFYKIFGLSRLFPRSKIFGRYHLGHLNENETHEIEILPGAFMFMRKEALNKAGLLDEDFFMYGEDIDLSYRIIKNGYKNYYFPETTIIHYKGESTKKGSINYVLVFYKAMMIFARKHFSKKNASFYIFLIYIAIYFRAGLSIFKRFVNQLLQPTLDAGIMAAGFAVILPLWEKYRFDTTDIFPHRVVITLATTYIAIWLISSWLMGAFDKPQKLFASAKGIAVGTLVILAMYALLPNYMRFSRAIILLNVGWSILFVQAAHVVVGLYKKDVFTAFRKLKRIAIVGNPQEVSRVLSILEQAGVNLVFVGQISPTDQTTHKEQIASLDQLTEFVRINSIDEIIFCSGDISSQEIIKTMLSLVPLGIDYKIAPPDSLSVIGSNSIDTSGDLYTVEISAITKPSNKRSKRFFDIGVALFVILISPLLFPLIKRFGFVFTKAFGVLVGRYTWVGYINSLEGNLEGLPKIRKGVYPPLQGKRRDNLDVNLMERINILYAKNYSVLTDLTVVWSNLFK
jgi:GT2 family glycosyltransferase